MKIFSNLKDLWTKIGCLGEGKYTTLEDRRHNALANWLVTVLIVSIFLNLIGGAIFSSAIYFNYIVYTFTLPWHILEGYMFFQIVAILFLAIVLKLKHVYSGKVLFELLLLLLYLVYLCFMTIFLGSKSGFQYFTFLFLPLPLMLHTNSFKLKLVASFAVFVFISLIFYLISVIKPILPLPEYITILIAMTCKLMSVIYIASILFVAWWYLDFSSKTIAKWKYYSNKGNELYHSEKDKNNNIITNQLSLISIIVSIAVVFTNFLLTVVNLTYNSGKWHYVLIYPLIASLLLVGFIKLYNLRTISKHSMRYEISQYLLAIFYVGLMSFLLGKDSGYYMTSLAFSAIPLFFSKVTWRFKFFYSTFAPASTFVFLWLSYLFNPIFPLEPSINTVLFDIILYYMLFVAVVSIVYLWRKYQFTNKLLQTWRTLSEKGNEHFNTLEMRKSNILTNQISLFFSSQVFILMIGVVLSWSVISKINPEKYKNYFTAYFSITLALFTTLQVCFYYKNKTGKFIFAYIQYFAGVCSSVVLSLFMGISGGFYYYSFVMAIIPFIALPKSKQKLIYFAIFIDLALMLGLFWWDTLYLPFFALPPLLNNILRLILQINAMLAIAILTYYLWNETYRTESFVKEEQKKSEILLLNILPPKVAYELKETGHTEPVSYKSASILFTDFSGFTKVTKSMPASKMVAELDHCFGYFDTLMTRYGIEKLKTIGDSFMAVGGIPENNNSHALDCVLAALEIQSFIRHLKEMKSLQNIPYWQIKIGINTGPLVAGVVGEMKYAYDVWGDSVNLASRMLSSGQNDKVNISQSTYLEVKKYFRCTHRGKIKAKNKGTLDMYFVNGFRKEFAQSDNSRLPNEQFLSIYKELKTENA